MTPSAEPAGECEMELDGFCRTHEHGPVGSICLVVVQAKDAALARLQERAEKAEARLGIYQTGVDAALRDRLSGGNARQALERIKEDDFNYQNPSDARRALEAGK